MLPLAATHRNYNYLGMIVNITVWPSRFNTLTYSIDANPDSSDYMINQIPSLSKLQMYADK